MLKYMNPQELFPAFPPMIEAQLNLAHNNWIITPDERKRAFIVIINSFGGNNTVNLLRVNKGLTDLQRTRIQDRAHLGNVDIITILLIQAQEVWNLEADVWEGIDSILNDLTEILDEEGFTTAEDSEEGEGIFSEAKHIIGTLIHGRNEFTPHVRSILQKHGNETIKHLEIQRTPLNKFLTGSFDALTIGQFSKNNPYDKLFHLDMVITTNANNRILLEKNETINMSLNPTKSSNTEVMVVPTHGHLTINQLLEKTHSRMGNYFYVYESSTHNCQDFILNILQSNRLANAENIAFTKQDTQQLFKNLDYFRKIANTTTDVVTRAKALLGNGKERKVKSKAYKKKALELADIMNDELDLYDEPKPFIFRRKPRAEELQFNPNVFDEEPEINLDLFSGEGLLGNGKERKVKSKAYKKKALELADIMNDELDLYDEPKPFIFRRKPREEELQFNPNVFDEEPEINLDLFSGEGIHISRHNGTNSDQLFHMLRNRKDFHGIFSKDRLPMILKNGWYIINLQDYTEGNGTHWTCFKVDNNLITYFDALGFPPPKEVMEHAKKNILYSNKQIQDITSTACGWFVVACIQSDVGKGSIMSHFNHFLAHFSNDATQNDRILYKMLKKLGLQ